MSLGVVTAILFFALSAFLHIGFSFIHKKRPRRAVREIPAIEKMKKQVNMSVEEGRRLHISVGNANLLSENAASAMIGLSVMEQMAKITMLSDRPPIITSGDGGLSILTRDVLHNSCRSVNALKYFDPAKCQLTGVTPFSYAGGIMTQLKREKVSCDLLLGNYGPEAAYLCGMGSPKDKFTLAASDSLPAQAVMFALADETLIGEELFALPAYLQPASSHSVSLRVQDALRWVLIVVLIGGAIIKIAISLLGISF